MGGTYREACELVDGVGRVDHIAREKRGRGSDEVVGFGVGEEVVEGIDDGVSLEIGKAIGDGCCCES